MTSIDEIKYSQYDFLPTINTIEGDQLRKELESIPDTIKYIRDKKIKDFVTIFRIFCDNI